MLVKVECNKANKEQITYTLILCMNKITGKKTTNNISLNMKMLQIDVILYVFCMYMLKFNMSQHPYTAYIICDQISIKYLTRNDFLIHMLKHQLQAT